MCGNAGGVIHRVAVGRERKARARGGGLTYSSAESGLKGSNSSPSAYNIIRSSHPRGVRVSRWKQTPKEGHVILVPGRARIRSVLCPLRGYVCPPPPPSLSPVGKTGSVWQHWGEPVNKSSPLNLKRFRVERVHVKPGRRFTT